MGKNCEVLHPGLTFPSGTGVWWWATFEVYLSESARVVFTVSKDGTELDRDTGPGDSPSGQWNGICAGEPIRHPDAGVYTLTVWDENQKEVLAQGSYTIVAAPPSPSASP
jgi:hypothetical protein